MHSNRLAQAGLLGFCCALRVFIGCGDSSDTGHRDGSSPAADLALAGDLGQADDVGQPPDGGMEPEADGAGDAGTDSESPAEPTMVAGEEGKSCDESCAAEGKQCVVACDDHRSCGSHDGEFPPYAGYACYYYEKSGGGVRFNQGRSLTSCDEVASYTWTYWGKVYKLGTDFGAPVTCCCL